MKSGAFMDIISVHYKDIVSLFKSRQHIVSFDEDLFGDAFIKCAQKFGNDEIDYDTAIKYFWVTYVNTCKSRIMFDSKHYIESIDNVGDIEIEEHDEIDFYNKTMDIIEERFGEEWMTIYSLYKYHNWSEEDLKNAGYECINIKENIKDIHKFIKSYYKKNKKESI